ncbi:MAG: hypothetical protein WC603_02990 [Candidatus Paceibacterota bacterium]|jgi:hypothetical protein
MENLKLIFYVLGAFVCLFLIGRFVVLWYFRINRIVELLENILEKLEKKD